MRPVIETVERTGLRKNGKGYTQTTIRHYWCACDVCGEGTYVNGTGLSATWSCPTCRRTSERKGDGSKVPVCQGRTVGGQKRPHEPVEMTTTDPVPSRPCRMTPRCPGRHRKPTLNNEETS